MRTYVLFFLAITISIVTMAEESYSWPMTSISSVSDDSFSAGCVFYTMGDSVSAAQYFQKAAKEGSVEGQYIYGLFKMKGIGGIKTNQKDGLRLIKQAAKKGNSDALYYLGALYEYGEYGVSVNMEEALNYYKQASQAGNLEAHIACGNAYWMNCDTIMAMDYWSRAAEQASQDVITDSQKEALAQITYNLGWFNQYDSQDIIEAKDYYLQSVEFGNTKEAAFQLGIIYLNGSYFLESDIELATYYFSMAAVSGQPDAYTYLGDILRLSDSDEQALVYYLAGAQSGNQNAMYALAEMYYEREEYESAVYWASQCSDNVLAVYLLGWIYYMQQDLSLASYYWQQCAFRFHYPDAIIMLKSLSGDDEGNGVNNEFMSTLYNNSII